MMPLCFMHLPPTSSQRLVISTRTFLSDIQSLNEAALSETYDVTAISFAAYPLCATSTSCSIAAPASRRLRPIVVSTKVPEAPRACGQAHRRSRPEDLGLSRPQTLRAGF